MQRGPRDLLVATYRRVRSDVTADPYLGPVLLLAFALAGFGIWYRVPNFAGPDEYSRLIQPMKVSGRAIADPSVDSVRAGVMDGRALGATFYLYGLVLVPVFVVIVLTGQIGEFASLGGLDSRWDLWHAAPEWFWTTSVLLGRTVNVVLAVACVYLTYRIGTVLRNRRTGRIAATLFVVTLGFVSAAHELAEDVPMLICFLGVTYLALRYLHTGDSWYFLAGCGLGGITIAFKLTGGVIVFVLAVAYLLRARRVDNWREALVRPRLLGAGAVLGFVGVYAGIPSVLVSGPDALFTRVFHTSSQKLSQSGGVEANIWYWFLRQYLQIFGLPLFISVVVGLGATVVRHWTDRAFDNGEPVLIVGLLVYISVFSGWEYVRMHHLLPTVPLLVILLASQLDRFLNRRPSLARPILAALVIASAVYVGVGAAGYTDDPRDQATSWMETTPDGRTVVFENSVADVAVIHGKPVTHYEYREENATYSNSLVLNESRYTNWMTSTPERGPKYIQLTSSELEYLDPKNPKHTRYPRRAAFLHDLLAGEYNYTVAAEFGDCTTRQSPRDELLRSIVAPRPEQREDCAVILARDGSTDSPDSKDKTK